MVFTKRSAPARKVFYIFLFFFFFPRPLEQTRWWRKGWGITCNKGHRGLFEPAASHSCPPSNVSLLLNINCGGILSERSMLGEGITFVLFSPRRVIVLPFLFHLPRPILKTDDIYATPAVKLIKMSKTDYWQRAGIIRQDVSECQWGFLLRWLWDLVSQLQTFKTRGDCARPSGSTEAGAHE